MQPVTDIDSVRNEWIALFPLKADGNRAYVHTFFKILEKTHWNSSRDFPINQFAFYKHIGELRITSRRFSTRSSFSGSPDLNNILADSIQRQTKSRPELLEIMMDIYKKLALKELNKGISISYIDKGEYKQHYLTVVYNNITPDIARYIVSQRFSEEEENGLINKISKQVNNKMTLSSIKKMVETGNVPITQDFPEEKIIVLGDDTRIDLRDKSDVENYNTSALISKEYAGDISDLLSPLLDGENKLVAAGLGSYDDFVRILSGSQNKNEILSLYKERINKAFSSGLISVSLYNSFMEIIDRYKYNYIDSATNQATLELPLKFKRLNIQPIIPRRKRRIS